MNNIIYNSEGINIIEIYKTNEDNKNEDNKNEDNKNNNIEYKYIQSKTKIIFDTTKENIIYNSDGLIYNYYYDDYIKEKINTK